MYLQAFCTNFVLQVTNAEGLGIRIVLDNVITLHMKGTVHTHLHASKPDTPKQCV